MPVITSIKPQKYTKRVNIYLDGKFGFGIDLVNFVKLGLRVEQSLDDEEIAKWWVEQRLEFKNKSKRDLEYELRMKGIEKEIIDNVLYKLKINEEEIAKEL